MWLLVNQTRLEMFKELRRYISRKSNVANYDAFSTHKDKKWVGILEFNRNNNNFSKCNIVSSKHDNIRALSIGQTIFKPTIPPTSLVSKEENGEFMAIFSDIVRDLTESKNCTETPDVSKRLAKILQYNVPNGKKMRGLSTVMAYKMLEKPANLTSENIRLANVLGWCIEMYHAALLIFDDIMDNSETRRGKPCWYKKQEVGFQAINDGLLLHTGLYQLLKKYFKCIPCYVPIVELFNDNVYKTTIGESLDLLCTKNNKPRLDMFTMNRYLTAIKYKAGYSTFYISVTSAMYLANIFDEELQRQCKTILLEIGKFFQIQDDFLDCFGHSDVTGKTGTDIKTGKCSWLAVVALQKATSKQRAIMEEHYGKPEEESIQAIRNLYEELNLSSVYAKYEEQSFNLICTRIQQLPKIFPHDLMFKIVKQIFNRVC